MRARARALCALGGAACFALSCAPRDLWFFAPGGFVLFALALHGASPRAALGTGWLLGAATTFACTPWILGTILRFTPLPWIAGFLAWVLASCVGGLPFALAAWMAARVAPVVGHPFALGLGLLVAERYAPAIFPWQLASGMLDMPALPQSADVLGVSGLGAVLLGCAALGLEGAARWREGSRWRALVALGLPLLLALYGGLRVRSVRAERARAPTVRVALAQPNVPPQMRWEPGRAEEILENLQGLTQRVRREEPALVVWPESMYPYPLPHRATADGLEGPAMVHFEARFELLTGAMTHGYDGRSYNSAVLRGADGSLLRPVDKQLLVPFGEYVPLLGETEWFRRNFPLAHGTSPGSTSQRLRTPRGLELGVLNCFEDTFPQAGAGVEGAELLVNVTNDGWFGPTGEPWVHLMLARWRAVELRRELVRAVNTGISAHVSADGRLLTHTGSFERAAVVVEVPRLGLFALAPTVLRVAPPAAAALWLALAVYAVLRRRDLTPPAPLSREGEGGGEAARERASKPPTQ